MAISPREIAIEHKSTPTVHNNAFTVFSRKTKLEGHFTDDNDPLE